ncbi:MAG: DUF423 domain-containing protein, partial [Burkholderiales bacterium]|nr:DUF423 domain-containing protein [Burkholderiales bacterium]
AVWHTAVEYHLFHALGLLIVGLIAQRGRATRLIELSGWLMVCRVFLFCGSLYALAWSAPRMLGFLTPIGGLAFIAAWLLLAAAAWRAR